MPSLSKNDIQIRDKNNNVLGTAEKVVYTVNKVKGELSPKTASVALYDVDLFEVDKLPEVFDVIGVRDDGIVQVRTVICNCSVKTEVDSVYVCVAMAPDAVED
jgi:hypothetical protein